MQFLDETTARTTIRELLSSTTEARLAVAFWGSGALSALGLDRTGLNLQILCNLESGACNPREIEGLQQARVDVRSNPRLHGKVYWTPQAVVLGSSNASSNGLTVEGKALDGWAEANVLLTDPTMIAATAEWIAIQWKAAHEVTPQDLSLAAELWKARNRRASPGARLTRDLVQAYREAPEHPSWTKLKVAIWSEGLSSAAKRESDEAQRQNPVLKDCEAYEDWRDELADGDRIIDINNSGRSPKFNGYWQLHTPKIETERLTWAFETPRGVSLPAFPELTLAPSDAERLVRQAQDLLGGAENVMLSFAEVLARLPATDSVARPGDPQDQTDRERAFEVAMLAIYDQAQAIGYRAKEFRLLVLERGGVPAARYLLQPGPPASGLGRLYELGRPELSVEALVQQPEWRNLFTEAELRVARQRYPNGAP